MEKKLIGFEPWKHQTIIITNACVYSIPNRTKQQEDYFFLHQFELNTRLKNSIITFY